MGMMKKVFFALCIAPAALFADCNVKGIEKDAPVLCGIAVQGGMLYGEADGWKVYKGKDKISKDGVFVFGLDRDEPEILELKFCSFWSCRPYSYKIKQREYIEQKVNVPQKFVTYSDDVQRRIDAENNAIRAARTGSIEDDWREFMDFSLPQTLKKFPISGVFGSRRVFNGVPRAPHRGLDIAAPKGTPAGSIAAGRVVFAKDTYMAGKTVIVSHGHGVTSSYLHLDTIDVDVGDSVSAGEMVGKIGATGRVSGAHLHLGINWRHVALDPELLMK
ncbi:MAG: M23 family metallopeptidase [Alphaproteobacteria bacterium]|nr:M23 family metallopeptidase [Alphaproteobacteria bacterium]